MHESMSIDDALRELEDSHPDEIEVILEMLMNISESGVGSSEAEKGLAIYCE